jgi:glutathione S-transferase
VGPVCQDYCATIMQWPPMVAWVEDSHGEPQEIIELDLDF